MKRFIISAFVATLLSVVVAPAFAAPHEHNLKTNQGVRAFWEEQGNRTGGGGD
jgi:flagellar motor component MotA